MSKTGNKEGYKGLGKPQTVWGYALWQLDDAVAEDCARADDVQELWRGGLLGVGGSQAEWRKCMPVAGPFRAVTHFTVI